MTERLYYTDAYLTDFEATVVAHADDGRRLYLDRTAFYPTSGGQPFDRGRLEDVAVVDVVDEGGRIAHVLEAPLLQHHVRGRVDWARRFDHMQQHTGQHLLSAVIADRFGHQTVSVHFGDDTSTLDLASASFAPADVAEAEALANAALVQDRPIIVTFESAADAPGLRKPSDRDGILRIVTIEGVDRSACGGTHVRCTGAIGAILVRKVERVKQRVRLEFVCGGRAVRRARGDYELLTRLAGLQSAAPEDLPALLEGQRAELKAGSAARRELEEALAGYRARELYAESPAGPGGRHFALVREAGGSVDHLRPLAQAFTSLPLAVFAGAIADPPAVLLAAAPDSGLEAGRVLKAAVDQVGGRGGGNARLAQGSVPSTEALDRVIGAVVAAVERG